LSLQEGSAIDGTVDIQHRNHEQSPNVLIAKQPRNPKTVTGLFSYFTLIPNTTFTTNSTPGNIMSHYHTPLIGIAKQKNKVTAIPINTNQFRVMAR
jgi:hypothetical protein